MAVTPQPARPASEQVGGEVADDRGADDHRPAHRGRALLGQVALGTVVADLLAQALPAERADRQRGEQDRDDQADAGRDEDRSHVIPASPRPGGAASPAVSRKQFEAVGATGLDEDDVAGAEPLAGAARGRRRGPARAPTPLLAARRRRPVRNAYRIGPDGHEQVDPSGGRVAPQPLVFLRGTGAQLGHAPEDGDPPLPRHPGQRGQRGPHRLGVGVVRVVDHGDAVGPPVDLHPPPAARLGSRQRGGDSAGAMPRARAAPAADSALATWCSPTTRRLTGASPPRRRSSKEARPWSSSVDGGRADVGVGRPADVTTRARVRGAIPRTRGSSAVSTAVPSAGSASTSSPFATAMPSALPNSPRWAEPTLRTTPTCGRATPHRRAMWPGPREPISSTRKRVSRSAASTVSGSPMSLLYEPGGLTVRPGGGEHLAEQILGARSCRTSR